MCGGREGASREGMTHWCVWGREGVNREVVTHWFVCVWGGRGVTGRG